MGQIECRPGAGECEAPHPSSLLQHAAVRKTAAEAIKTLAA
ncbi:hypothetical protein ACVDG8_005770 [Mesorhizobium sp. ORM8.1]